MVAAQLPLLPRYLRLPFSLGTWAFTFSWAAVASTTLFWIAAGRLPGDRAYSYLTLAAISILVSAVAARTILALVRGQLLPRTAAGTLQRRPGPWQTPRPMQARPRLHHPTESGPTMPPTPNPARTEPSGKRQVLITGGSRGIGLALATRYQSHGADVLITGRDAARLDDVTRKHPGLRTQVNDISRISERERLAAHVRHLMPDLDIVINNAGIQRRVALAADNAAWPARQQEIDTLLSAPIHLNHLLIPTMLQHGRPALIINVTSGGAFIPQPFAPIYSASKAALHSYTMNLRLALAETPIRVVELIPPAVATGLAGPGATHGAPVEDYADAAFAGLDGNTPEVGFGPTDSQPFRDQLKAARDMFDQMSQRFSVQAY